MKPWLSLNGRSYSLHEDDVRMFKYLEPFDKGVFIECGAHDGIEQSNTKFYEDRGWTGLLVEPNIHKVKACVSNRPNSIVEHYALVSPSHSELTVKGFFQFDDHGDSLCGRVVDDDFKDYKDDPRWNTKNEEPIEVPCITLSKLLEKNKIDATADVHFFSLDVEGYELRVLEGLDLGVNRPLYILIERGALEEQRKYMDLYNYNFVKRLTHVNDLYKRSS